jgi:hypothetical protein
MSSGETSGRDEALSPTLPRVLPAAMERPTVTGVSSTQPVQVTSSVHLHSPPAAAGRSERKEQQEAEYLAEGELSEAQQMRLQLADMQRRIDQLVAASGVSSAADSYRTPVSTSYKRQVQVPAQRSIAPALGAGRLSPGSDSSEAHEVVYESGTHSEREVVGVSGMTLKDVIHLLPKYVDAFYADSSKDTKDRTAVEFVENVESVLGNFLMDHRSPHRLFLVGLCLKGNALHWMDRRSEALRAAGEAMLPKRDYRTHPLSWDDEYRRAFIQAHQGTDTSELWRARLVALKLGEGRCMTPIELDSQFDMMARRAFPDLPQGDPLTERLLAPYYADIVRKEGWLYKNIVRGTGYNGQQLTLQRWKQALANAYAIEADIRSHPATSKAWGRTADDSSSSSGSVGQGGRGRGGGGRGAGRAQSVNAMESEDTRQEGEELSGDQQVAAASGTRGGRGGRGGGGRGRGGYTRKEWSPEKQQLWADYKCFHCQEKGHMKSQCPKLSLAATRQQLQSNEQAGQ